MGEQNPLKTGPSDKNLDSKASTSQQEVIDTAKHGLKPQKNDRSSLHPDAAKREDMNELAQKSKWWESSKGDHSQPTAKELDPIFLKKGIGDEFGGEIHQTLKKWNQAGVEADNIRGKEVYSHLPEDTRKPYEDKLKEYEDLERDYGSGPKQASDIKAATKEFNTLNENMRKTVEFEQKVYDLTGMLSEQFSSRDLSYSKGNTQEINAMKVKVANAADRFGWKGVMERTSEVIQQTRAFNSYYIIDAIQESKDKSLAPDLANILSNKELHLMVRMNTASVIGNLGDKSVAPNLANMLSDTQTPWILSKRIIDVIKHLDAKPVKGKLNEIRDDNQVDSRVRQEITNLLQKWES